MQHLTLMNENKAGMVFIALSFTNTELPGVGLFKRVHAKPQFLRIMTGLYQGCVTDPVTVDQ
jgi:hypothetical protein